MSSRAPSESDRADAILRLLGGLVDGHDLFELARGVADLHPKNDTFPGEVYIGLASDALALAGSDRDDPIAYQGLVEGYLSESDFRGWDKRKIQYAILSSGALHGRIEPDLLRDTAWRTDDFWRYALFAAAAVIRASSARLGIQCPSLRCGWLTITTSSCPREPNVLFEDHPPLWFAVGDDHCLSLPRQVPPLWSAAGARHERRHYVGGMPVKGLSRPVVTHRRSRVSV